MCLPSVIYLFASCRVFVSIYALVGWPASLLLYWLQYGVADAVDRPGMSTKQLSA